VGGVAEISDIEGLPAVLVVGGTQVGFERGALILSSGAAAGTNSSCAPDMQEEVMDKAKLLLSNASRKLAVVAKQSRSWLMLYVLLFCVGLFTTVYVLNKLLTLGRLFFWR
jgi:hypothetical protein